MISWEYNHQDYLENNFAPIPPGKYRVRIESVEEKTSRTGKQMYEMVLKVSGYAGKVWHYVVFDTENRERTNRNLGLIFESFNIPQGKIEPLYWIGKVGGAQLKQEPYNDKMTTKVSWFLTQKQQEELPPWQEKPMGNIDPEMASFNDSDVPF